MSQNRFLIGAALIVAFMAAGTSPGLADSIAKIDQAYPAPPPVYPDSAQLSGEQGDVVVEVQVGANGRPRALRLRQSSGYDDLDNAGLESAANWRYIPAIVDGDVETGWMTVRIHYQLPQYVVVPPPATPAMPPKPSAPH